MNHATEHRGYRLRLESDGYVACKAVGGTMRRIPTGKHSIKEAEAFLDSMFYKPRKEREKVVVEEVVGTPPFRAMELLDPSRWNSRSTCLYRIKEPCVALAVKPSRLCVSGWGVEVETERGVRLFDAEFFKEDPMTL